MTCIQDQGVAQQKSQEIQKLPRVGVLQGLSASVAALHEGYIMCSTSTEHSTT